MKGGNHFFKYESKSRLERWVVSGFLNQIERVVERVTPHHIHEVGCGEGEITRRLLEKGFSVTASDQDEAVVRTAKLRHPQYADRFFPGDFVAEPRSLEPAPLILCCEVLEHLNEVELALDSLQRLAQPYLLVTVPNEPLWRALNFVRGRYRRDWGNTPGHVQHWSAAGITRLLESRFEILQVLRPLPWTLILGRNKRCQSPFGT